MSDMCRKKIIEKSENFQQIKITGATKNAAFS